MTHHCPIGLVLHIVAVSIKCIQAQTNAALYLYKRVCLLCIFKKILKTPFLTTKIVVLVCLVTCNGFLSFGVPDHCFSNEILTFWCQTIGFL